MGNWLREFVRLTVGTPRRFLITLGLIALMIGACRPELVERGANAVWIAFQPLIQLAIQVGVLVLVFGAIIKGVFGRGGGGGGRH